jgi:hypothetical protein
MKYVLKGSVNPALTFLLLRLTLLLLEPIEEVKDCLNASIAAMNGNIRGSWHEQVAQAAGRK